MHETAVDPLSVFREVNTAGTERHLVQEAIRCGVRRLIFLSTIGVNGEVTPNQQPFSEQSPVNPHDRTMPAPSWKQSKF